VGEGALHHPQLCPYCLLALLRKRGSGPARPETLHLQLAIKGDLGIDVPMPKGRSGESHFGGKINEEVAVTISPDLDQWSPEGARLLASIQDREREA